MTGLGEGVVDGVFTQLHHEWFGVLHREADTVDPRCVSPGVGHGIYYRADRVQVSDLYARRVAHSVADQCLFPGRPAELHHLRVLVDRVDVERARLDVRIHQSLGLDRRDNGGHRRHGRVACPCDCGGLRLDTDIQHHQVGL